MNDFEAKLKAYLHDPIDKCFDIRTHEIRAEEYAQIIGISNIKESKGPDEIASCMERSTLPKDIMQDLSEIKHPLSEGKLEISKFNKEEILQSINSVFKDIANELNGKDVKFKFFWLWRNLQQKIFLKNLDQDWIKYLPVLPADTRVPDHSIWEHLKVASAINAFKEKDILIQNNSIFLFSIGPVQSFISQARKTQDFYMGSFILSYFTFEAIKIIIDKYGPSNIIYPELYMQPLMDKWIKNNLKFEPIGYDENLLLLPTIPNRFVAILPTNDETTIFNLTKIMENEIKKLKDEALNCILEKLEIKAKKEIKDKIKSQLNKFPEIYWVAIPWKIEGNDIDFENLKDYFEDKIIERYQRLWNFVEKNANQKVGYPPNIGLLYEILYSALEKSMGMRKNLRQFSQSPIEEIGRKCSICGERDAIFFKESKNKEKFTRFNPYSIDLTETISPKYLEEGEGLCAICFLKRTFDIYLEKLSDVFKNLIFPSTAEISLSNFKEKALSVE